LGPTGAFQEWGRRFRGSEFRGDEGKLFEWRWVEVDKGLFSCGDVPHPSLAVVTCSGEESKGSVPLNIHSLAVVEEKIVSYSMSSNWVVERVNFCCCVVGL
jgi:hypothetical protein